MLGQTKGCRAIQNIEIRQEPITLLSLYHIKKKIHAEFYKLHNKFKEPLKISMIFFFGILKLQEYNMTEVNSMSVLT